MTKATSGRALKKDDHVNLVGQPLIVTVDEQYYKQHLELAYVTTVDTSQGAEAVRSITIAEDTMARSRLGTGTTRGKLAPIYIVPVDPNLLPVQVEDAAVEKLKQILQRDDVAKTAHETGRVQIPQNSQNPQQHLRKRQSRKAKEAPQLPEMPPLIPPLNPPLIPPTDGQLPGQGGIGGPN